MTSVEKVDLINNNLGEAYIQLIVSKELFKKHKHYADGILPKGGPRHIGEAITANKAAMITMVVLKEI